MSISQPDPPVMFSGLPYLRVPVPANADPYTRLLDSSAAIPSGNRLILRPRKCRTPVVRLSDKSSDPR